MQFSKISEEAIAELRSRIGKPIQRVTLPTFTEINADAARLFSIAIGDNNPLWTDPAYAAKTRWQTPLAPPSILYSTDNVVSGAVEGLPSVHAMYSGTDWQWFGPVKLGTKINTKSTLKAMVEHQTRFAGRAFQQIYTTMHAEAAAVGSTRTIYLIILISHIILAAGVLPLILLSFYRGLQMQVEKHKKLVRWTFPIWLYVTVTGVIVYLMVSPYYHF